MHGTRRDNLPPQRLLAATLLALSLLSAAGCGILTETFPGSDDSSPVPANNGVNNNNPVNNNTGNNNPNNTGNNNPVNNNPVNNNPGTNNNTGNNNNPNNTCYAACAALDACLPGTAELFSPRDSASPQNVCLDACLSYPSPLFEGMLSTAVAPTCEELLPAMTEIACAAQCDETLTHCPDGDDAADAQVRCAEGCQMLPHTLATPPNGATFECLRAAVEQSRPLESEGACAALEERRAACTGPSDECMEYCALVQTGCTDEDALFSDEASCLEACALLPLGADDADTLSCRLKAAAGIEAADDPAAACLDASPASPRCATTEP